MIFKTPVRLPYFKITIWLKTGPVKRGIRRIEVWNIDVVFNMIKNKVNSHYRDGQVKDVDVYMLSKHSTEVKKIIHIKNRNN